MVTAMCGVQLNDRKRYMDLMFILDLSETIDQLAMANSVCWYGHVLRREDDHVLRKTLHFEVDQMISLDLTFFISTYCFLPAR